MSIVSPIGIYYRMRNRHENYNDENIPLRPKDNETTESHNVI